MGREDAPQKLTRLDILDEWPEDFDKPSPGTLKKWLDHAEHGRLLAPAGTRRKNNPFRYWLPAGEEVWKRQQPLYDITEQQRRELNLPWESLREKRRKGY